MWPVLLDMTKEESMQSLRNLELEAYAHLVSALRAQGPLNPDKRKLLKDTSQVLNIPQDRHKAEIRRAVNDEKLNTIAYHVTGLTESLEDWAQEGRRSVPLIPRMAPQTAYSAIADEAADSANQTNKHLPQPALTERKRPPTQPAIQVMPETSKSAPFRVPDAPKNDDSKKRKLPICTENSSLAQHLLGPPKMTRTQQIYRQRTKSAIMKLKPQPGKPPFTPPPPKEEPLDPPPNDMAPFPKPAPQFKPPVTSPGPSEVPKTLKVCPKKPMTKTGTPLGQKLIVVSNAQSLPNSSILQKTLSIPLVKNISVKNFEKFKIVTTTPQLVTATNNSNSLKHKVVTVKTNPTKKMIPLSLINSKGNIKVLPIGGKIVAKTTTTSSPPLYIVNTMSPKVQAETPPSPNKENGKSSVLGDILKASGVTADDFDTQIEEFRIPNNHVAEEEREQVEEEEKDDFVVLEDGEEVVEESECKDIEETVEESETVVLTDLTSVSDTPGN